MFVPNDGHPPIHWKIRQNTDERKTLIVTATKTGMFKLLRVYRFEGTKYVQICSLVGKVSPVFQPSTLIRERTNRDDYPGSIDQGDRGPQPARMPGERDACKVV
tara:strand:+ start:3627 stop:3938 length:312 start_codon:yes stop_codon:yes gene_type:complete